MPNRILRSTAAGNVPASLVSGQIAINEADGKLFYRAAPSGTVTQLNTGSGGGGSTNASDLTSGTLADARLSVNAQAAITQYIWSTFR